VSEIVELDASLAALWRRKWLVLAGAVLAAAVAGGVAAASAPRYTTTALVEVGRVMGDELEDAFAVAQTINSAGFQDAMRKRAGGPLPGSVSAEALTGGQGRLEHPTLVRLTATSATAEGAVALGRAAADEIVARHAERFDGAISGYRDYERVLAATGEAAPADAASRKDLFDLRAKLASPVFTAPTRLEDPFPTPSAPEPKNAALSAAVAFAVAFAVLVLLVVALAQAGAPRPASERL
jgi:hypothetical protein